MSNIRNFKTIPSNKVCINCICYDVIPPKKVLTLIMYMTHLKLKHVSVSGKKMNIQKISAQAPGSTHRELPSVHCQSLLLVSGGEYDLRTSGEIR